MLEEWQATIYSISTRNTDSINKKPKTSFSLPIARSVISAQKADLYCSYEKLAKRIKKAVLIEVLGELNGKLRNSENFHPYLLTSDFWFMNYNVYLTANKVEKIGIDNIKQSPLESLMDYFSTRLEVSIFH